MDGFSVIGDSDKNPVLPGGMDAGAGRCGRSRIPSRSERRPPATTRLRHTFDILLDVALPVSVSFGKTSLQIREVLKLNTGSIVELDRLVADPVEVIVNNRVIARGEVVVVDGNYGVRINQLASRDERLRSGMSGARPANRIATLIPFLRFTRRIHVTYSSNQTGHPRFEHAHSGRERCSLQAQKIRRRSLVATGPRERLGQQIVFERFEHLLIVETPGRQQRPGRRCGLPVCVF